MAGVLVFFEVHHWPHTGRVLVLNKVAHRDRPVITWLEVTCDGAPREDATVVIASALAASAAFDVPDAVMVVHDRHGNMLSTPAGLALPVTVLRRAPGPAGSSGAGRAGAGKRPRRHRAAG